MGLAPALVSDVNTGGGIDEAQERPTDDPKREWLHFAWFCEFLVDEI